MKKIGQNIRLHILNSSGKFDSLEKKIYKVSEKYINKIGEKIPITDVDIVYLDNPWGTIGGRGIGGSSKGAHVVLVSLELEHKDIKGVLDKEMPRTLAHELHHVARFKEVGHRKTLLDALVAEGLAGHFERELFGEEIMPWYKSLKGKDLENLFVEARKHYFDSNDPLKWFFGKSDPKIPKWSGYTIGYKIVSRFLSKNPEEKTSNLYDKPSKVFI